MPREKLEATDRSVFEAYESGQLVGAIFSYANYQNDDLREACVRLHNTQIIDLLALVHTKEFEAISLQDFFAGQKLYCDVLPDLDAPVAAMTSCIKILVNKAGNDLAANFPHEAFRKWCEGDFRRAREIIDGARNNEESAKEFLTVALISGSHDQDAREFVRDYVDTRRLSGIFALGRIKYEKLSDAADSLTLLHETVSNHTDDILFANVLSASFDIANNSVQTDEELLLTIVTRVCGFPGPAVLDACAQVLWHHQSKLSQNLRVLLFNALKKLPVTQKGTLRTLDFALSQLLSDNRANEAIDFLKEYLASNDEHLTLSEFKSFESALRSNPAQLQRTLLTWMLTAKMVLCEGVAALFRNGEDKPFDFDVPVSHLDMTQQIFVCRKIIGYLFTQPLIACSFLVCVLRQCNNEVADSITKLLFDPMLRSYGGVKSYLSAIQSDDNAYARIMPALQRADNYIAEINSIGEIKELHPSESARQAVSLRDFDEMQEARKEAEKDSVLLNLVSRSVVLHGRRTLSYMQPIGQGEPMEMELHAHSFEFEMPRQSVLDPVGIEYVLRVFRAERFIA